LSNDSQPDYHGTLPNDSQPDYHGTLSNDSQPDYHGTLSNDSQPDYHGTLPNDSQPDYHGTLPNDSHPNNEASTYGDTADDAGLMDQLVVIVCFSDLNLYLCRVPVSHTLVHSRSRGEGSSTWGHGTVTQR
jgi:hypothetical protein